MTNDNNDAFFKLYSEFDSKVEAITTLNGFVEKYITGKEKISLSEIDRIRDAMLEFNQAQYLVSVKRDALLQFAEITNDQREAINAKLEKTNTLKTSVLKNFQEIMSWVPAGVNTRRNDGLSR